MALKTVVKISGVNNLSDARYCAGMGVEMLGFCLEEGRDNFVSPEKYQEIVGWISGVKFVGEFDNISLKEMNDVLGAYPIHALQVARQDVMAEIHRRMEESGSKPIDIIYRLPYSEKSELEAAMKRFNSCVKYFLLDIDENLLAEASHLAAIQELAQQYPLLLGTGVSIANVEALLADTAIKGIALQGGNEIKPGLKDFDELADVLETIEID